MILSDDKISHVSHLILRSLKSNPVVRPLADDVQILREIKRTIIGELKIDEEVDAGVRRRLSSYSRQIAEGSPEWEVLYRKTFREEMAKRKR